MAGSIAWACDDESSAVRKKCDAYDCDSQPQECCRVANSKRYGAAADTKQVTGTRSSGLGLPAGCLDFLNMRERLVTAAYGGDVPLSASLISSRAPWRLRRMQPAFSSTPACSTLLWTHVPSGEATAIGVEVQRQHVPGCVVAIPSNLRWRAHQYPS